MLQHLAHTSSRPTNMLNDDVLNGLTWSDLEMAFKEIACPAKKPWVKDLTTGLWKHSLFYPEPLNLLEILKAGAWLASPEFSPGSPAQPTSPS